MNKRHPTLVNICLHSQESMNYLFKSWKSAIKYIHMIENEGWTFGKCYSHPRNPNLKNIINLHSYLCKIKYFLFGGGGLLIVRITGEYISQECGL